MEIGAQFYTIRDFCKTTEDFAESLKKVADIGYKNVQISGTCAFDADWLAEQLKSNGLRCVLTHTPPDQLKDSVETVVKNHDIFACDYVGLGYYEFGTENLEETLAQFVETYRPIAEGLKKGGKYFMYHNHDKEFRRIGDKTVLDCLAEKMPADLMGITMDTFWVQAGGGDPARYLEKLSGRVPCIHLKDYAYGRKMAVIGEGNINFDRVFEKAEQAGTKYMLVEQDDCNGEDPFDCLKRSYEHLHTLGFE